MGMDRRKKIREKDSRQTEARAAGWYLNRKSLLAGR
jgi:hypothetical protein